MLKHFMFFHRLEIYYVLSPYLQRIESRIDQTTISRAISILRFYIVQLCNTIYFKVLTKLPL